MSQFDYMAEGDLNSTYVLELIKDYLTKVASANDTNEINKDAYKINSNASKLSRWFKNFFKEIGFKFNKNTNREDYNKVLTTKYIETILDKVQIYLQTDVLEAKQFFELTSTLKAIKFGDIVPPLEEYRHRAIKSSQMKLSKTIQDAKYLKYAKSNYILYNSPVEDLKPFLSKEVSEHVIDYKQVQILIEQYITIRYKELTKIDFEEYIPNFKTDINDFYNEKITDNGVGDEVEDFIRSKMLEKLKIATNDEKLPEDINMEIAHIDLLLKRLKVAKIEQMLQQLVKLKYDLSRVKEVVESCKETINGTTIPNKAQIFLKMDSLYYKLSKRCEALEQKTKSKLQVVDKQKLFSMLDMILNPQPKPSKKNKKVKTLDKDLEQAKDKSQKSDIISNLYDDDDLDSEIDISEDGGSDSSDDEIIID